MTANVQLPAPARSPRLRRPTMAEVAKASGVARSTVSGILSNRADCIVSPRTRQRVLEMVDRLGYRPNVTAQALRGGRTHTLGVIDSTLDIEVVANRCSAFEMAARRGGYLTTMSFSHPGDLTLEDSLVQWLHDRQVDGIVICPNEPGPNAELRRLIRQGFPVVTVHGSTGLGAVCDVTVDFEAGGRLQGEHLIELGRKRICLVQRQGPYHMINQRRRGLQQVVEQATGGALLTAPLRSDTPSFHRTDEQDYHDLRRFIREQRGTFDAIVGINDEYALCAMRAALDEGLRVPDDVAVIGFDNIAASRLAVVPLTTVAQPTGAVAQKTLELLAELVEKKRRPDEVERVVLQPTLVVRASTVGDKSRTTPHS